MAQGLKKILIAPDKFKGTLSARQAAEAMAAGVRQFLDRQKLTDEAPEILLRPLADGGEGSLDALLELSPAGRRLQMELPGPDGNPLTVPWVYEANEHTIALYLETALVIGLELPGGRRLPPLRRNTAGVGVWINRAIAIARDEIVRRTPGSATEIQIHLFLGGSATSDGGFGMARELGFRFSGAENQALEFEDLEKLERILPPALANASPESKVSYHIYTDVQNPLTGPRGAAVLFGPQKGATPEEVEILEARLEVLERGFQAMAGKNHSRPGIGAAGGLALPLLYEPGRYSRLVSGIQFFLHKAGIDRLCQAQEIDLILTGEGCSDRGTLTGKVVAGLLEVGGGDRDPRLAVFSGKLEDESELRQAGLLHLYDTISLCGPPGNDLAREAAGRLSQTVYLGLQDMYGPV